MTVFLASNYATAAGRLLVLKITVFSSSLEPLFCIATQLLHGQGIGGGGRRIYSRNLYRMVVVMVMLVLKEPMVLVVSKTAIFDNDDVAVSGVTAPADTVEIPNG